MNLWISNNTQTRNIFEFNLQVFQKNTFRKLLICDQQYQSHSQLQDLVLFAKTEATIHELIDNTSQIWSVTMKRSSRSTGEIQKLVSELNLSERILSEDVDGCTENTVNKAWKCIERHRSMMDIFKQSNRKLSMNTGSNFVKKRTSRLSLGTSIKFPVEAFTAENSTEFSNPDLFSELYPMAYTSACE